MARYLLLSGSYGNGHNAAKDAIKKGILSNSDNEVEELDMVQLLRKADRLGKKQKAEKNQTYFTETFPTIWETFYNLIDKKISADVVQDALDLYFKNFVQSLFNKTMLSFDPDYIVITYPMWGMLVKNFAKKHTLRAIVGVVPTDAGSIASTWRFGHECVDAFFVIDHHTQQLFYDRYNHPKKNVFVSFFPISPEFFYDKIEFGPSNFMMLLSWLKEDFALEFLDLLKFQLYFKHIDIIEGRNPSLFKKLKKLHTDKRYHFKEYINIKESLPTIDIFIGKPGGAIMSECIAQDTLMVAPNYIAGHEEGNIYLLQHTGTGIFEDDPKKLVHYLDILNYPKILQNFHKIKRKNSVEIILSTLQKLKKERMEN